jgi:hypothetical protein
VRPGKSESTKAFMNAAIQAAFRSWERRHPGGFSFLGAPPSWRLFVPGSAAILAAFRSWERRHPGGFSQKPVVAKAGWKPALPGCKPTINRVICRDNI